MKFRARALKALSAVALVISIPAGPALAAIGTVIYSVGEVRIVDLKTRASRPAAHGMALEQGDSIVTGTGAQAQLRMSDGAFIAVRPGTEMKFDQYSYGGREDGSENALISLVKGGFRSITGLIGNTNKDRYRITTPVATVGIRGTDLEVLHIEPAKVSQVGTPGALPLTGTILGMNDPTSRGFLENSGGRIEVDNKNWGIAPSASLVFPTPPMPGIFKATPAPTGTQSVAQQQQSSGRESTSQDKVAEQKTAEQSAPPPAKKTEATAEGPKDDSKPVKKILAIVKKTVTGEDAMVDLDKQVVTLGQFTYDIATKTTTDAESGETFLQEEAVSGGVLVIGDFGVLAMIQAQNALNSLNAALAARNAASAAAKQAAGLDMTAAGITPASDAAAQSAISNANMAIAGVNAAVTSALALSLSSVQSDAAMKAANSAASLASATSTRTSATSVFTANGAFQDSTAAAAKTAMDSAFGNLGTANTSVQADKGSIDTQVGALAAAKSSVSSGIGAANGGVGAAVSSLNAGTAQNSNISAFQAAAMAAATNAAAQANAANGFAGSGSANDPNPTQPNSPVAAGCSNAATCSDLAQNSYSAAAVAAQTAKNFSAAQEAFRNAKTAADRAAAFAQQAAAAKAAAQAQENAAAAALAAAQGAQNTATSNFATSASQAGTAQTQANNANTQAGLAQTAFSNANTAATNLTSTFGTISGIATTVAQQAVIAQYNNPANATANQFASMTRGIENVGPGGNNDANGTTTAKPNTNYVLDGAKNLVEIRSTPYASGGFSTGAGDVKFAGGIAREGSGTTFVDPVRGSIYFGRWEGGTIDINPTITLGPRSAHWIVGFQPNPPNFVQSLGGTTTFTRAGNTSPTDAAGAAGTLTTATLSANFDAQTVTTSLAATFAAKAVSLTAAGIPITGNNFFLAAAPATCTGAGCSGTSSWQSVLDGQFYRDNASAVGLSYSMSPVGAPPVADLVQGVVLFTTATPPTQAPTVADATLFASQAVAFFNAATTSKNNAAASAASANTAFTGIPTPAPDPSAAAGAIFTADSTIAAATTAVNAANVLSLATQQSDAATKATSAASAKTITDTTVTNATGVFTANGAFQDATAGAAKTAMDAAKTALNSANTSVQSGKTSIDGQVAPLGAAKTSATNALASANTNRTSANSQKGTGDTAATNYTNAFNSANTANSNAAAQAAAAAAALGSGATTLDPSPFTVSSTVAANCATAKACSDLAQDYRDQAINAFTIGQFTNGTIARNNGEVAKNRAQTHAGTAAAAAASAATLASTASTQAGVAGSNKTSGDGSYASAVTSANTANTLAGSGGTGAQKFATDAQTAVTTANTLAGTLTTDFNTVNTQKTTVDQQAKIAQYNNPANATANQFASMTRGIENVGPGSNNDASGTTTAKANTNYVLDGAKNLVEIRNTPYASGGFSTGAGDVKFAGGIAREGSGTTFVDATRGSIYFGRWEGGTIDINPTITLGPRSAHWIVGFQPNPPNFVQSLGGTTTFARAGNTSPTDAAGAAGTLTTATLSANFDAQTVTTSLAATFAAKAVSLTAAGIPITGNNFFLASAAATCVGAGCSGTSSWQSVLDGQFYRSDASAVGLSYSMTPTGAGPTPPDMVQGVVLFTTATPPVQAPTIAEATAAASQALVFFNNATTSANGAATSATAANSAATGIPAPAPDPTAATNAISTANSTIATATTAVGNANALSLASTQSSAASNATTSAGAKTSTDTTVTNATSVFTANGAFADSTATPAKTSMDSAKTTLNTANTAVQSAKTAIDGEVTNLASAKTSATSALAGANSSVSTANSQKSTGDTAATNYANAAAAANTANTSAATQSTNAANARGSGATTLDPSPFTANSSVATSCGSAKACSDLAEDYKNQTITAFTGGQFTDATNAKNNAVAARNRAQTFASTAATAATSAAGFASTASTQAGTAGTQKTSADNAYASAVSSANAANTSGSGAQGSATAAQNAVSNANTQTTTLGTNLTTVTTQQAIVNQQAKIAQHNNPRIALASGFGHVLGAGNTAQQKRVEGVGDAKSNTNYVLDGAKALVEIRSGAYQERTFANAPGPDVADADIKLSGGTPANVFVHADNTVHLGRITGGTLDVDDNSNGVGVDFSVALGSQSLHYLIVRQPDAGFVQTRGGTTTYSTLIAATQPTDVAGNVGTLTSQSLSANFTAQTVNAAVGVSIAGKALGLTVNNMPIVGNSFSGANAATCSGAPCNVAGYLGLIGGGFARTDVTGAGFSYGIFTDGGTANIIDMVRGVVALGGAAPAARPLPAIQAVTSYRSGANTNSQTFEANGSSPGPAQYVTDLSNNLTMVADSEGESQTVNGGTAAGTGSVALAGSVDPIRFGRFTGNTLSGVDFGGSFTNRAITGGYQWMYGPQPASFFLSQALTGTSSYTSMGGSAPVDQSGATGTLNSASLSVDFTKQSVNAAVNLTSADAAAWIGTANNVRLDQSVFYASTSTSNSHNFMTVTRNGGGAFGSLAGALMGNALQGAGFTYAFSDGGPNSVTGSAAFTGSAQSTAPSYVPVIYVTGKSFANYLSPPAPAVITVGSVDPTAAYGVEGAIVASSRIIKDGTNANVGFDGALPVVNTGGTSTSEKPVAYVAADAVFGAPPTPGGVAANVTTMIDKGTDATTGITWGRYSGIIKFTDRVTNTASTASTHINAGCAAPASGCNEQWHVMFGPSTTALPVLPTSGTVNYTFAGGTLPTNSMGQVAAAVPTAQLSANFTTNMVGFNVPTFTVGANTWAGSTAGGIGAPSIPILKNQFFEGALNVTTNLGGGANGKITGAFTGNHVTNTQAGAMVGFAMNQGGVGGTTVSGSSAFRKP